MMQTMTVDLPVLSLPSAPELDVAWRRIRTERPTARTLDVAKELGVSELTLLLARRRDGTTLLRNDLDAMLPRLGALGEVMALTRNASCVIEKTGLWAPFSRPSPAVGLVLDKGLDLRLFLGAWVHCVAVVVDNPRGPLHSLQWFDAAGRAVHKLFLKERSDRGAFEALVTDFAASPDTPSPAPLPAPIEISEPEAPPAGFDGGAFRAEWLALKDTHDFFPLVKRHGLARRVALETAPAGHAARIDTGAVAAVLQKAAETGLSIMVFVGNDGCIGIHTGPVKRVMPLGNWLNVLDPDFNLHLRADHVDTVWRVTKPTDDGPVTSLELFDADRRLIAQLFGERKPGRPELNAWRDLVMGLG